MTLQKRSQADAVRVPGRHEAGEADASPVFRSRGSEPPPLTLSPRSGGVARGPGRCSPCGWDADAELELQARPLLAP